ncbi:murein L,D-transpeptidase catalytic domain family protein [Halomonas cibimaris]|uniref:Murein L,D-transpeptidase catalytic domain family protein n=1 Tax=Halomonas cibimaris TaxID=657012 RepID=A0ABP7LIU4_9GAMM
MAFRLKASALLLSVSLFSVTLPLPAADFFAQLATAPALGTPSLHRRLGQLAPGASPQALRMAAEALACADPNARRLALIDFSRPSTKPRLWVFDLEHHRLLFKELVSHGQGSGDARATAFSNVPDSHQSSLGLFRTMNSYYGRNGYSLRLDGLEPDVNDHAFERAIVIHGADYVSEAFIDKTGRLGRSHGCPAVRTAVTYPLIDSIKDEQYVFAYYPDEEWLASSAERRCDAAAGQQLAQR